MEILKIIILQIIASFIILAEFVIPSFGILSISAAIIFFWSLKMAYSININFLAGIIIADIFAIPFILFIGVKLLASSKISLKSSLSKFNNLQANYENLLKVGEKGKTVTPLRPCGKIIINGKIFDATAVNNYIDKDCNIEVVNIHANKIEVRKI